MKDLGRIIKNVIGTLMTFSIFFIVLAVINSQSEYVFPYTIFKALGWSALLYGIYTVVMAVYFFVDHLFFGQKEKEKNLTNDGLISVIALILFLIGGVFLNICY